MTRGIARPLEGQRLDGGSPSTRLAAGTPFVIERGKHNNTESEVLSVGSVSTFPLLYKFYFGCNAIRH